MSDSKIGSNSMTKDDKVKLKKFVEQLTTLEAEKQTVSDDIKLVYASAKEQGFDTKALRKIMREMKADRGEVEEFETIVDLYRVVLGLA